MKRVRLAYGKSGLEIALRDDINVDVIEPRYIQGLSDAAGAVREALRHPVASKPLRERVRTSDTVAIVVNDITRATPYDLLLPVLLDELSHVPDDHITILVATGTHRPTTEAELSTLLGHEAVGRFRIVQNNAQDRDSHALVGTTHSGNAIWVHREYLKSDLRILTGFIEPHIFAGFSGGGKACLPGMTLLETTLRNHCPAHIDHPKATWGVTQGNPIREEIQEAARMAGPGFLLNVAMNRDKAVTEIFAGDIEKAHEQGCESVRKTAMVRVSAPYDIVITSNSGYPLDLNLYQSVKGMSAAAQIVRKGGAIILAADCWDGIPDHGEYKRLLFDAQGPAHLLARVRGIPDCGLRISDCGLNGTAVKNPQSAIPNPKSQGLLCQDSWQAQIHASICEKATVHLFSDHLSDEDITRAMLTPCRDIAARVDQLIDVYGPEASIAVMPEGPLTIPYLCP